MHSYPISFSWDGQTPLTVPAVPTGRNAGVRNSPRSVAIFPARAGGPGAQGGPVVLLPSPASGRYENQGRSCQPLFAYPPPSWTAFPLCDYQVLPQDGTK